MKVRIGTSGYSYKEWKGSFYPEDIKPAEMLSFYAERLGTVEINNTFYRMPKREVLQTWSSQVGEDFRFVLKTSQKITHFKRLRNANDEMSYLMDVVGVLGGRLGAMLVQLPPTMKKDTERLAAFLDLLGGRRAAFECRHESWHDEEVVKILADRGHTFVAAETDEDPEPAIHRGLRWGYLRLRKSAYSDVELGTWSGRIADQGWDEAFVFFKHEQIAPGLASRMAAG
jgi:uncharacterized protein YecE (DUF72 family)